MNVLIVGAAGYVASIVIPGLEASHTCRLLDRRPVPGREPQTQIADVTDERAIETAVRGMDAVIYLAMGVAHPDMSNNGGKPVNIMAVGPAFAVNTAGLYNCIRYGMEAGVKKFVYASTISVWTPEIRPVAYDETRPPDAFHVYGVSKHAGELVMQRAAQHQPDLTFVALRLFAPRTHTDFASIPPAQSHEPFLGPQDTLSLFQSALACDHPGFHCVMASGDMVERYYIHRRARDILGWSPRGA